jgi:uncharacterized protein YbaR (Trm112 family)
VSLDPLLLEILACPDTHHAPLAYDEAGQTLTCTECARIFPIRDGLPVLLLDDDDRDLAETVEPAVGADDLDPEVTAAAGRELGDDRVRDALDGDALDRGGFDGGGLEGDSAEALP